jgi:calcineurin-like phosphoesterase family protein
MSNIFLTSDTHFGHANILTFLKKDGTLLRPGFKDITDHNLELVKRWNSVVSPNDKVYHLGDVGFKNFAYLEYIFNMLNGTKVLIKGNHDNFTLTQYQKLFKDVRAVHVLDKLVLTHVPIHPQSISRWRGDVHGHLHENVVMRETEYHTVVPDERYMNVCVEHTNYTPIPFEEVRRYYENLNL